jgi:hypothetical protein
MVAGENFFSRTILPPLCTGPAPDGGGGSCDSVICTVQVLRHYRNRGATAAGRSPGSVTSLFFNHFPKAGKKITGIP